MTDQTPDPFETALAGASDAERPLIVARLLGHVVADVARRRGMDPAPLLELTADLARHTAAAAPLLPTPCAVCAADLVAAAPVQAAAAGYCPHRGIGYALAIEAGRVVRFTAQPMTADEAERRRDDLQAVLANMGHATRRDVH
jgi:hypothetical protein